MRDTDCVRLLQWALPRLGMRWPGFRKVRAGVCKRIGRRLRALDLADVAAYRAHLEAHPAEWEVLDGLCRVSISRFYRDRGVFARIEEEILPELAKRAQERGEGALRAWSCGCASGEEPYTLALLWQLRLYDRFPELGFHIVATDVDAHLLERARRACYGASSLKALPADWREVGFERVAEGHRLREAFREGITFFEGDMRRDAPQGPFHLILCRNLAFTYFDTPTQRAVLARLAARLLPGGFLVIGAHEALPEGEEGLVPWRAPLPFYRKEKPEVH